MAVSGKTAAPHELPYYLGTDKPPDMAAVTKALAERTGVRLDALALSQLAHGAAGQLIVVQGTGAAAYKALSGDATITEAGAVTIANDAVTAAKIAADAVGASEIATGAVGPTELAASAVEETKIKDGAATSRKLKPTIGIKQATALTPKAEVQDIPGCTLEITPSVLSFLKVTAVWGMTAAGVGAIVEGHLSLDGATQTRKAYRGNGGGTDAWMEVMLTQVYLLELTAALHTIKLRCLASGGELSMAHANTGYVYELVAA